MRRPDRKQARPRKARDEVAGHISEMERSQLRLQRLYDVSKLLTQFQSAEQTLPEVLASIERELLLRSAIFILESADGPRVVTWQAAGESAHRLEAAQDHAQTTYGYLVRSSIDVRRDSSPPQALSPRAARESDRVPVHEKNFVMLPLVVNHSAIFGALQIESVDRLEEADLAFLNAVVNHLAVAIDRHAVIAARQESAEARERQQRFLAEATAILSASLDYRETLAAIVRLMVPTLADVCFLDELMDDGRVRRLEVAFADDGMRRLTDRMRHLSPSAGWTSVLKEVLATGRARLIEQAAAEDYAFDEALRAIGAKSWIVAPLVARGRTLGAIKLVAAGSRRHYSAEDLAFAEELAGRAGLAMDNARLYDQAQGAVRAREDLLAIVSHDLRSPLNMIAINLRILRFPEGNDRRDSRKQLASIERSTTRMTRLIDDLLDAATIEAGHLSLDKTRVPVGPLVAEAIDSCQPLAASKPVQLKIDLSGTLPAVIADAARLQQVFANLVDNAIKFTAPGGVVTVRAESTADTVTFSVADTGSGIGDDVLPRLFSRFSQAKMTARFGTGLGLFIVKGIVEAHRGRVWVESKVGKGSTFFFSLPVAPGETDLTVTP